VSIRIMDVLIILVSLGAGGVIGWLLAVRVTETRLRGALVDAAGLRVALDAERAAAERREALLLQSSGTVREMIGDQAADALDRVQQQLAELDRARVGSDAAFREQVRTLAATSEHLRTETAQLVTALRAPQVRGRWGEMQLERIVEAAGLTEHVDYVTQASTVGDGPVQRPDLVVRLTQGKQVVVDSKVAFSGYLEAMEARDEAIRDARLKAHARQLRNHIDKLSAKAYWQRFTPTPEFVICFVPADTFLDAALREDPSLLEHAFQHDVVLATPSTLVALLRTIAYGWRQHSLATNAEEVLQVGRELYRRLATMGAHIDKLGRSLGSAVTAYNDTVGSLERRVLSTARQMNDLGVVAPSSRLDAPEPLRDAVPRPATASELVEQRVLALHPKTALQAKPLPRAEPPPLRDGA